MKEKKNKPCAIVLAAGLSRRMGKEDKLLKKLNGKPLVSHILLTLSLLSSHFSSFFVVGNKDTMKDLTESFGFSYLHNENPSLGMGSSLSIAVRAAQEVNVSGYLIFLGDMPHIQEETIRRICHAHWENPKKIIQPVFNGKPGNPVLFPSLFYPELASLSHDFGGREIMKKHKENVLLLPVTDSGVLKDYDTKEDF